MRVTRLLATAMIWLGSAAASAEAFQQTPQAGMPTEVERLFRDGNSEIGPGTRCEVIDWAVSHPTAMPPEALRLARRQVDICVLPHDDMTPAIAAGLLGAESFHFDVAGDVLTVLARSPAPTVTVCCAPQMELSRLRGSSYWVARRRLGDASRAMISLALIEPGRPIRAEDWRTWRGPEAPPKPEEVEIGKWTGKLLQPEFESGVLGEKRKLAVYLPPGWSKDKSWPALFMSDAGAVEFAGLVEKMIEAGEIAPIVIVSAESGERAIVGTPPTQYGDDLRSAEYLRFWPRSGDRFDRHMEFFAGELVNYAISEFGVSADREERAVSGESSGGVLAMWAGLLRPEIFANAIPMSPGYLTLKPEHLSEGERARIFVSGGKYEPPFIAAARAAEAVLQDAGYEVTGRYYAAGHYHDQWAVALREALMEIFPPR